MTKLLRGLSVVVLGIAVITVNGCATTCGTSYRRELTSNPDLAEANESYRKAISWLDNAECSLSASEAQKYYTTAEYYLSDAI